MTKRIALLSMMFFVSGVAMADDKASARIDFNKMIDENNLQKNELHRAVSGEEVQNNVAKKVKRADKSKTIDFIDVEIGVGDLPTADRRFDSVGEARVAPIESLSN